MTTSLEIDSSGYLVVDDEIVTLKYLEGLSVSDQILFFQNTYVNNSKNELTFMHLILFVFRYHNYLSKFIYSSDDSIKEYKKFDRNISSICERLGYESKKLSSEYILENLIFSDPKKSFYWDFELVVDPSEISEDGDLFMFDVFFSNKDSIIEFNVEDLLLSEIVHSKIRLINMSNNIHIGLAMSIVTDILFSDINPSMSFINYDTREGNIINFRDLVSRATLIG